MGRLARILGALFAAALLGTAAIPNPAVAADSQHITMYIFGGSQKLMGPDGNPHDTTVPASFVVKAGQPVTVTVINYDEGPHSITSPELGLNAMIQGGKEQADESVLPVSTTFTFTPKAKGNYRWYCAIPCDAKHGMWAMGKGYGGPGKEGFMAGEIVVI